jgi:antitoxin (DNA-binding transcriptional repressor) of toxin-antitoxin stability system
MKDVRRALDRGESVTVLQRGKEKARLVAGTRPPGIGESNAVCLEWNPPEPEIDMISRP